MNPTQRKFRELVEDGVDYVPAGRDHPSLLIVVKELVRIHNEALRGTLGTRRNMGFHCVNDIVRTADIFRALVIGAHEKFKLKNKPKYLEAGAGTGFFTAVMSSLGGIEVKAAEQDQDSLILGRTFMDYLGFNPELIEQRDLLEDPVEEDEYVSDLLFAEQICGDTGTEHFHRVMQAQARDVSALTIPYSVQPVLGVERKKRTPRGWESISMRPAISMGKWTNLTEDGDPHLKMFAEVECPSDSCSDITVGLNIRWLKRGYQVRRYLEENMENALQGKPFDASLCVPNTLHWRKDEQRGPGVISLYNPTEKGSITRIGLNWPYGWRSARDPSKRWANVTAEPPVRLAWRYADSLDLIEGSD